MQNQAVFAGSRTEDDGPRPHHPVKASAGAGGQALEICATCDKPVYPPNGACPNPGHRGGVCEEGDCLAD